MNNDVAEAEAELVAGEPGQTQLWSIGPFDRPAAALRWTGKWLAECDDVISAEQGDSRSITALNDVRLQRIGYTWWAVVEIDGASVMQPASAGELREARR